MNKTGQDKPNHPEYVALRSLSQKLVDCVEHIIETATESGQTEYTVPYEIITDKTGINVEFNDAILTAVHEMLLERPELTGLEASETAFHLEVIQQPNNSVKESIIQIKNNRILYSGNTAGYITQDKAVVDPMFENDELKSWLSNTKGLDIEWTPGTYEQLIKETSDKEGNMQPLKCRIWQLKPDVNPRMKFMEYGELLKNFGEPDLNNYRQVYDGDVGTHNMDAILIKFTVTSPPSYKGHRPSTSDIIELYDTSGGSYFYMDGSHFRKISFKQQEQELNRNLTMGI